MYAGFWRRFAAYLIDHSLLIITIYILALIIGTTAGIGGSTQGLGETGLASFISVFSGFFMIIAIVIPWFYFSLMESSTLQATLGKMALGIRVTDYEGKRVSFGRAAGRYLTKVLSVLTFTVGFIMAGFTPKKQALHDMIAGTLVVKAGFAAENTGAVK